MFGKTPPATDSDLARFKALVSKYLTAAVTLIKPEVAARALDAMEREARSRPRE
jgi:tagatose-1,6-bisphosphate aldolase